MDTAAKIARLERRMDQLDKIIALINLLRRLTGYAFERAHEIHILTKTALETGKGEMVLTLSQHQNDFELRERSGHDSRIV